MKLPSQYQPNTRMISDNSDNLSTMVYVKTFYLDDVIEQAPHVPHPAFIVEGKVLDGIYISKYQNVILEGRAYSLPDRDPTTCVNFDTASAACLAKGEGFHLLTAAEWGALALWCHKNGTLPHGNNDGGKDIRETETVAKIAYEDSKRGIFRTATGTGPVSWSHDGTEDGIYDLNANVWEWIGGMRLVYGELQILPNNNGASQRVQQTPDSLDWRAIDGTNGSLLIPDGNGTTKNSIKLDFIENRWIYVTDAISSFSDEFRNCRFADITTHPSICKEAKLHLYALGCLPPPSYDDREVSFFAVNAQSERIPFRGGRWGQGLNAGVFKTCLDDPRSYTGDAVGFRSAYYEIL